MSPLFRRELLESTGLLFILVVGLIPWALPCAAVAALLTGLGDPAPTVGAAVCAGLYLLVARDAFRALNRARTLPNLPVAKRFDYVRTSWATVNLILAVLCWLSAAWLIAWQALHWLQEQYWPALNFMALATTPKPLLVGPQVVFSSMFTTQGNSWLIAPTSWIGLHAIVVFVLSWIGPPVVLGLIAIGFQGKADEFLSARGALEQSLDAA